MSTSTLICAVNKQAGPVFVDLLQTPFFVVLRTSFDKKVAKRSSGLDKTPSYIITSDKSSNMNWGDVSRPNCLKLFNPDSVITVMGLVLLQIYR